MKTYGGLVFVGKAVINVCIHFSKVKKKFCLCTIMGKFHISCKCTKIWSTIGPLQFTITCYKNCPAGEQATHWNIQNKRILSKVAFFWISQWAVCSLAWRFLYHVIVNCKGPMIFTTSMKLHNKFLDLT